jgi:hypothetical protein
MKEKGYRPSILGPLILITAGILLLLNQAGRLPWTIWGTLWRFWPVIIILIGIEILVGVSRSTVVYIAGLIIAAVVLVAVVVFALYVGERPGPPGPPGRTERIVEPMRDANRGRIELDFAVGTLEVGALADSPNFVEGEIEYSRYSQSVQKVYSVRDGQATLSLEARSRSMPFWLPGDVGERWELRFTPDIPLELEVDAGAATAELDLTDLWVTQVDFEGGVGRTTIAFPAAVASTEGSISGGVGEITLQIPEHVGARIRVDRALTAVRVENARFVRSGDEYVSTNYTTAENKLEMTVESAIGAIIIR